MVIKRKNKQSDERLSPALVAALDEFVEQRSRDIALVADFGLFARPSVYGESINAPEVNWRIVSTAYLLYRSALPVRYGIRTSVDCLRIVRSYFDLNHKLHNHKR